MNILKKDKKRLIKNTDSGFASKVSCNKYYKDSIRKTTDKLKNDNYIKYLSTIFFKDIKFSYIIKDLLNMSLTDSTIKKIKKNFCLEKISSKGKKEPYNFYNLFNKLKNNNFEKNDDILNQIKELSNNLKKQRDNKFSNIIKSVNNNKIDLQKDSGDYIFSNKKNLIFHDIFLCILEKKNNTSFIEDYFINKVIFTKFENQVINIIDNKTIESKEYLNIIRNFRSENLKQYVGSNNELNIGILNILVEKIKTFCNIHHRNYKFCKNNNSYSYNKVEAKKFIHNSIYNSFRQFIIKIGKISFHKITDINTTELEKLSHNESFARTLSKEIISASMTLRNTFQFSSESDVLVQDNFFANLLTIDKDSCKKRLMQLFNVSKQQKLINDFTDIEFEKFSKVLLKCVSSVRNKIVHYKKVVDILSNNEGTISDFYDDSKIDQIFEIEFDNINNFINKKLFSMKIFDFYSIDTLSNHMKYMKLDIKPENIPHSVSFKKVITMGINLNYFDKYKILNKDRNINVLNNDKANAHYNLLNLLYKKFLTIFTEESSEFKKVVNLVENNKKERKKGNKSFTMYSHIEKYNNNPIEFLKKVQASYFYQEYNNQKVNEKKQKETYSRYLTELYLVGFDNYLYNHNLYKLIDSISDNKLNLDLNHDSNQLNIVYVSKLKTTKKNCMIYGFLKLLPKKSLSELSSTLNKLKKYVNYKTNEINDIEEILNIVMLSVDNVSNESDEYSSNDLFEKHLLSMVENNVLDKFYQSDNITPIMNKNLIYLQRFGNFTLIKNLFENNKVRFEDYDNYSRSFKKISEKQESKIKIHNDIINNSNFSNFSEYKKINEFIKKHNYLSNKVELREPVFIQNLVMDLYSRFISSISIEERDLRLIYFGIKELEGNPIRKDDSQMYNLLEKSEVLKTIGFRNQSFNSWKKIRNDFMHLNYIYKNNFTLNELIKDLRTFHINNRSLKNNIVKSIIKTFEKYNIICTVKITKQKDVNINIKSMKEIHLKKIKNKQLKFDSVNPKTIDVIKTFVKYDNKIGSGNKHE